jgi:hypothetical protein
MFLTNNSPSSLIIAISHCSNPQQKKTKSNFSYFFAILDSVFLRVQFHPEPKSSFSPSNSTSFSFDFPKLRENVGRVMVRSGFSTLALLTSRFLRTVAAKAWKKNDPHGEAVDIYRQYIV